MKSVMIGIRVSESVNSKLKELADKRGVTVSAYIKAKLDDFVNRVEKTVNNEYVVVGGVRYRKH